MKIREILEKHVFDLNTLIKQIQIKDGKRFYIIKE